MLSTAMLWRSLLAAGLVLLAGCGHAPPAAPQVATEGIAEANAVTADGQHNDFDVMFLQMMIAH